MIDRTGDATTSSEIVNRYAAIIAALDETETAALWAAALFGRTPTTQRLREAVDALQLLRDEVGRSRRKRV